MRFLHTADWHVGKTLRGRSRLDEHAKALEQVAAIAADRQVDAVLVAGDLYDSPAPPPEAEKLVYDFLARLLAERIACVVIAGNHDHPRRLSALASLLERLRIHVRPEVRPPAEGGVVRLASRDGGEEAAIAVLPFVPERKVVDACTVMDAEYAWYEAYSGRIEQILAALARGLPPRSVQIVLAHLLVDGARVGTGERELHLGQIYGVSPQQLPSSVQYIGLGHLHRPQEVLAPAKTLYAGSLVELDFGEKEQDKRVVVLEAKAGRPVAVESVPITAGRRLRDVAGTLEGLRALAGSVGDDFLRVTVRVDSPVPGLAERVKELLPNALDVTVDHPRNATGPEPSGGSRVGLEPATLFAAYYERRNRTPPPPELQALFAAVYEEASR
ncbi:MAG TPA: exonuclease SbcCD subunit D [Vicinamibacteria bacterium]|nr:exonuclease SbcCD subunit D [Vicinamibacteria bacterium]